MHVRAVLTLLLALSTALAAGPAHGQSAAPEPRPDPAVPVAHPRAAVLTVFDGTAESFLLDRPTSATSPLVVTVPPAPLRLAADYEAVMLPRTAGWARFRLAVSRVTASTDEPLDQSRADVVGLGPLRKGGRLVVTTKLPPGLHHLKVVVETGVRAVAAPDWTVDSDTADLWVLVPGGRMTPVPVPTATPGVVPGPAVVAAGPVGAPLDAVDRILADAGAATLAEAASRPPYVSAPGAGARIAIGPVESHDTSFAADSGTDPDPALPVGGLAVGAQRGIAGEVALGAVNFEQGHGTSLTVRAGQPIQVWSDYELWLPDSTRVGEMVAGLTVHLRANAAESAPLAEDAHRFVDAQGPRRDDGTLVARFSLARPGRYPLVAELGTRVARGGAVAQDRDEVPFEVVVVGDPPSTGAIAGVVVGADGLPLEGVAVDAVDDAGRVAGTTRSVADGRYVIDPLRPGKYLVHARPGDLNYLDQWFKGHATQRDADPVEVRPGASTIDVDFELVPGGTIAGRVVGPDGKGIGGIEITVGWLRGGAPVTPEPRVPTVPATSRPGGPPTTPTPTAVARPLSGADLSVAADVGADDAAADDVSADPTRPGDVEGVIGRTVTNDDGHYAVDRLPAGIYWVRARDPKGRYLTEYYDDKPNFGVADRVPVEAGKVAGGIDFELETGGAIAGHVREQSMLTVIIPLAGIEVEVRGADDPERVAGRAVTGRDGDYTIGGLPDGRYVVRAADPTGRHVAEWFRESPTREGAELVAVRAGETTDSVDFTLERVAATARVLVEPTQTGVRLGGSGRVTIAVDAVANLGAFEVSLRWDPSVIAVDGVDLGDFLGSTGRQVVPVGPEIDQAGGTLRYAAASVGSQAGPGGRGALFVVRFTGRQVGATALAVEASTLTDPTGRPIAHERAGGRITVGECMLGDFDCNCVIDIRDLMMVVRRWGTAEGDPDWDARFDLDRDRDVDIVDVQIEASWWGRRCDAPTHPTPTPRPDREPVGGADEGGLPADPAGGRESDSAPQAARGGENAAASGAQAATSGAEAAPAGATVSLEADASTPGRGEVVTIGVDVAEAGEVDGFQIEVAYDPAVLRPVGAETGAFLSATGRLVLPVGPTLSQGAVRFAAASVPGKPAPTGAGRLAVVRFEVIGGGTTTVTLSEAVLTHPGDGSTSVGGASVDLEVAGGATALVPLALRRN